MSAVPRPVAPPTSTSTPAPAPTAMAGEIRHLSLDWRGSPVRIEYQWLGGAGSSACASADRSAEIDADAEHDPRPLIVFLHEGLGSLAMWRDFPAQLCAAVGARGLVYSRPGYGRSTPRAPQECWDVDFLHRQAHEVLPALLQALQVRRPCWLLGHSDGGSIALLYAARHACAGAVVVAPHIVVEDLTLASIEQARDSYRHTDLKQRLARYHDDPDSAFWGWNRIWLHPPFRHWSIADEIATIACPLLAVQGVDDEYGTLEQIRGIARRLPQTQLLELPDCRHAVHKDQPTALTDAVRRFLAAHNPPGDTR